VFVPSTRDQVQAFNARGLSGNAIARELGLSKSTVAYHLRRLGEPVDERCNRRYDWQAVQRYYDLGHSVSECVARFGFSRATFHDAARRGALVPRPQAMPLRLLLVNGSSRGRPNIKNRLVREGLKAGHCELCGLVEWLGRPLSLCLHHVNGDGLDNRLENLQLLCPNCHSQTENFGGRNRRDQAAGRARPAEEAA
jgi:biotin operon repressor